MSIWVNGRRAASLDCRDRGLQYGDGLFETMRVRNGAVRLLELHLERLQDGCRRLLIDPPDPQRLRREIERAAARRAGAVLKLIVTRGVGPRGYRPSGRERSTRILSLAPLPHRGAADAPVTVRICRMRLGHNERLAGLKTLNRLESVLARSEWRDARVREGLMRDGDDTLVCGTMSNLFLRRGGLLVTPLLDRCGVAGVMRRWVLGESGRLGFDVIERRVRLEELWNADEVFMTNAVAGLMSVAEIRHGARRLRPDSMQAAAQLRAALDIV
jgi:4-amino-4-deoxychorismate lyase